MRTPTFRSTILWTAQTLLAALFLFAGSMKFVMPVAAMNAQSPVAFSGAFIHFIGVCEILGALGLLLPGITRIHRELTPLAAAGLVIIMIGATAVTLSGAQPNGAVVPAVVGVVAASIAYGRRRSAPLPQHVQQVEAENVQLAA